MSPRHLSLALLAVALLALAALALRTHGAQDSTALAAWDATEAPLAITSAEVEGVAVFELGVSKAQAAAGLAPVRYDRRLRIEGTGFYGTSFGPFVAFDGVESGSVTILSESRIDAFVPATVRGPVLVRVSVPDGRWVERVVRL